MEYTTGQGITDNGGGEVTIRNGVGESRRDSSSVVTSADAFARDGLMGTAKSPSGGHVIGREVHTSDTIQVAGQRCTIALALSMGLIRRDAATGDYIDASAPSGLGIPYAHPKVDPQMQQAGAGVGLASGGTAEEALGGAFQADADTEGALAEVLKRTTQGGAVVALESIIREGELNMLALDQLASQSGLEPAEMAALVNNARDGMEDAVYQHLEQSFPVHDRDMFTQYIHSSPDTKAQFQASVRDLMHTSSVAGFAKLAQGFTERLDVIDPDAVADALDLEGITYKRTREGILLDLSKQGLGQMMYRQAVQAGLIKPQRA
ncbi:hypothetical protein [Falsirhodobacter xinxiangensis]|uniref:hypothetical protein n=1 Tax=Falsirhodobacter xinxiangensis TaxID=2530049 RepID=UPI0010AA7F32|nr:hypothetical protein [Rhodobacter xinxiangensis]